MPLLTVVFTAVQWKQGEMFYRWGTAFSGCETTKDAENWERKKLLGPLKAGDPWFQAQSAGENHGRGSLVQRWSEAKTACCTTQTHFPSLLKNKHTNSTCTPWNRTSKTKISHKHDAPSITFKNLFNEEIIPFQNIDTQLNSLITSKYNMSPVGSNTHTQNNT